MFDASEHSAVLNEIVLEWAKAEADLKRAEQICHETLIPSILELRYAGRRLADALDKAANGGNKDEIRALLEHARFGCHCARHDAIDTAFAKMISELILMRKHIGDKAIIETCPNFSEFWAKFYKAQKLIVESREKRAKRDEIYSDIMNAHFEELADGFNDIMACKPLMERVKISHMISIWGGWILSIIAIVIAVFK